MISTKTLAIAAVVLTAAGIAAGVALGRRTPASTGAQPGRPTAQGLPAAPQASPELQPLARELAQEDASTPKLLEGARVALQQEQFALAIPAYRRVLDRDPKNPEALTGMGYILYRANHVDQALARLDEALRADPKYPAAHWHRGHMLYVAKKDLAGAAASLEAFLAVVPQGSEADRARALLAEIRRGGQAPKP